MAIAGSFCERKPGKGGSRGYALSGQNAPERVFLVIGRKGSRLYNLWVSKPIQT